MRDSEKNLSHLQRVLLFKDSSLVRRRRLLELPEQGERQVVFGTE